MICYLSLGSNVGNRRENLKKALELLADLPDIKITKVSRFYETEPWGGVKQEFFINIVIEIQTVLDPEKLLTKCQEVENLLGRKRLLRWGPRIIDIDILTYGNLNISSESLTVPHPYMEEREFVLAPLREITPHFILPSGRPIAEVKGEGEVKVIE